MEESKNAQWEVACNRFVAFLDIMGFKDMMARRSHEEIYTMLENVIDMGKAFEEALVDYGNNISVFAFSDSIIVLSKNDLGNATFLDFSHAVSKITGICMGNGVPIKGGCAHGLISYNRDKNILCGQAYIDAYTMQESLQYYGIVCHHSIDNFLKKDNIRKPQFMFRTNTIMKESDAIHFNFDWFYAVCQAYYKMQESYEIRDNFVREIIDKFYLQVSGKPRIYVDNTVEMHKRYLEIHVDNGKAK